MGNRIRKDDLVTVVAGKDRGERGRVLKVLRETDRVIVEGVNRVRKHRKPRPGVSEGGIVEIEASLHISNVMLIDPVNDKRSRVRFRSQNGKKERISAKSARPLAGENS